MMSNIPEGYKQTEVGVIPEDWIVTELADLCSKLNVGFVGICEPYFTDEANGILLIRTGNLHENDFVLEGSRFVTTEFHQRNRKSQVIAGDILIARHGSSGNAVIVPDYIKEANTLNIVILRINEKKVSNYYSVYAINSLAVKNQVYNSTAGSTQGVINTKAIAKLKIPLPPTQAEQTAIATALNDADALISKLEKLIAKKRNIKRGAMQELLKPKAGWEVKKLGEIFKFLNTANNSRADLAESGEVEYIHYGDIHTRWNCFLDCSKNELPFIDKAKVNSIPFLENGDLVIADASEDYEGLATCVEIKNIEKRKIVAGLHTLLLRGDKNIMADGFKGYLRNYHGVKDTLIRLSTGVSVFGISKTNLKEVEVSIPPTIEEQTHIVQILSDMEAEIEALENKLEKYKMIKQGMMQNLLTGKIRLV